MRSGAATKEAAPRQGEKPAAVKKEAENLPALLAENLPALLAENLPALLAENLPALLAENSPALRHSPCALRHTRCAAEFVTNQPFQP